MIAWTCPDCGRRQEITIGEAMSAVTGALLDTQQQLESRLQLIKGREQTAAELAARAEAVAQQASARAVELASQEERLRDLAGREAALTERESRVAEKERRLDAPPAEAERFALLETD